MLVKVPTYAYDFNILPNGVYFSIQFFISRVLQNGFNFDSYGKNKQFQIIGTLSDILKDEYIYVKDWLKVMIIKKNKPYNSNIDYVHYKDYTFDFKDEELFDMSKSTDSFLSYLQSIELDLTKSWLLIQKL